MPEYDMLFYLVFLSQVLLISFYLPKKVLSRLRYIVETYPPSKYPRLYPVSIERVKKTQRLYRIINFMVLLAGFGLLFIGLYSPSEQMLNWDTTIVLTIYMVFQYSPLLIAATSGFTYFNLKRKTDSQTTRKAELRPRRLFDFVSPAMIGLAAFVYVAFACFVHYISQFEFPWFGGYWNIVGVTVLNLLFAGIIFRQLYGKKKDPYQAHEDRRRQIELTVKSLVFVSIAATIFIAISVTLNTFDLRHFNPVAMCLYFQVLALISFREFRIDNINFEVYRGEPLVA